MECLFSFFFRSFVSVFLSQKSWSEVKPSTVLILFSLLLSATNLCLAVVEAALSEFDSAASSFHVVLLLSTPRWLFILPLLLFSLSVTSQGVSILWTIFVLEAGFEELSTLLLRSLPYFLSQSSAVLLHFKRLKTDRSSSAFHVSSPSCLSVAIFISGRLSPEGIQLITTSLGMFLEEGLLETQDQYGMERTPPLSTLSFRNSTQSSNALYDVV